MASSDRASATLEVRLTAIEYGADSINLYRFSSLGGEPLPAFEPGAHIDVQVTPEHARQYSLLYPPRSDADYEIAVQHVELGRGGSKALHSQSVVGGLYTISSPRNNFPLSGSEREAVLLAGGIGITPLVSMYRWLKSRGKHAKLFYWSTSPRRTLFLKELSANALGDAQVFHTGVEGASCPRLSDVLATVSPDAELYCCGPGKMLEEFDRVTAGRPPETVHRERFNAQLDELEPGGTFRVLLQRSQRTFTVGAEDTLLDVCRAADIDVSYSCEEGVCGACEVKVLAGQVDHRDSVLTPAQRATSDRMMICCSRGIGDTLVLDL